MSKIVSHGLKGGKFRYFMYTPGHCVYIVADVDLRVLECPTGEKTCKKQRRQTCEKRS